MSSRDKKTSIFTKMLITEKVPLEFQYVNKLLTDNLYEYLKKKFEGKCCEQGYIKPETINIINYSSGIIRNNLIIFDVAFECLVCYLVEGMEVDCIAKNITKAGIRAELDMEKTPAIIFVARDHHYVNKMFNEVEEGNNITVKIIGQRFELNDVNVSAIAELVKVNKTSKKLKMGETISGEKLTTKDVDTKQDKSQETKEVVEEGETQEKEKESVTETGEKMEKEQEEVIETVAEIAEKGEEPVAETQEIEKKREEPLAETQDKKVVEKEVETQENEVTIVPDKVEPPKKKRGRPRKNPI
jgi:hypothetical protein